MMFRESVRLLRKGWKPLLLFELGFQVMSLTVFVPLIGWLIDAAVRLTGLRYLTMANLELLMRSFWMLPLAVVLLFLAALYMLIQFSGVIVCLDAARKEEKLTLVSLLEQVFSCVRRMFASGRFLLMGHLLLLLPVVTISAAGGLISTIGVPDVMDIMVSDQRYLVPLYAGLVMCCTVLSVQSLMSLPAFVERQCSFRAAMRQSRRWMKGKRMRVLLGILLWNALYLVLLGVLLCGITALGLWLITLTGSSVYYGKMPLRILRYCLLGIIFLFSVGAVPYFSAGVMTYYNRFQTRQEEALRRVHGQRTVRHADRKRRHVLAVCVSIAMLLMDLTYLYRIVSGDVSLRFVLTVEPMVIAHRGASTKAPENTAYAFYKAMELGADGIELDIQQTADGVLVVTHDQNLKRISGWNQKISEVTYAELQDLDVGSWFQPIYQNARLMTLEEVFQLTDGTVFLNIELKSDAVGENLEEKVADLILQYGMENRCCVTSFSYQVLKKIKACDPEIQTGFLMNHAYGDFYDLEAADVFSIRSVFITQKIVDNAHENGKEIYAWTVNTVPEMQRMLNLSVDHIITDKPELLQAQINRDSTEDTLLATVLRLIS